MLLIEKWSWETGFIMNDTDTAYLTMVGRLAELLAFHLGSVMEKSDKRIREFSEQEDN